MQMWIFRARLLVFPGLFLLPLCSSAASIAVAVSPQVVKNEGAFRLTMVSEGMSSCQWSRYDNDAFWAWRDEPLPSGNSTVYDSGELSGWSGPASYRWDFSCRDDNGGSYVSSAWLSIQKASLGFTKSAAAAVFASINIELRHDPIEDLTVSVDDDPLDVIGETIPVGETLCVSGCGGPGEVAVPVVIPMTDPILPSSPGDPEPPIDPGGNQSSSADITPAISVSPDPTMYFNGVPVGRSHVQIFTVENKGPSGSLLSGSVTMISDDFFCVAGCDYNSVSSGGTHNVSVRFDATGREGDRIAQADFSGGGGARRFVNGFVMWPPAPSGALHFGEVVVGRSKTLDLVITNNEAVHFGSGNLIVSLPFACESSCAYTLPPHSTIHIPLSFTPVILGEATEVATLSGVPGSRFTLTGEGIAGYWKMFER